MKIKPMHDRVIVELIENESISKGGIIIPDTAKEKPQKGKVIACGGGTESDPMQVKVGDTVLFSKYAGTEVDVDGKVCLLMRESDIFCTL
jgi:chaperonin GroES